MHVNHNVDDFRAPFTEETFEGAEKQARDLLTPTQVNALSTCLTSIHGVFDEFLAFDLETARTIPVFHFVRVAYAAVVLIKMYLVAATPGSQVGKIFGMEDIKVERYLDSLLDAFRATADDDHSRAAGRFLMVLVMLKTWFQRRKDGKGPVTKDGSCPRSGGRAGSIATSDLSRYPRSRRLTDGHEGDGALIPTREPQPQGRLLAEDNSDYYAARLENRADINGYPNYNAANTPLQLLSEVATGDSEGGRAGGAPVSNSWYQSQTSASTSGVDYSVTHSTAPNGFLGAAVHEQGSTVGTAGDNGLETAMEMTLGDDGLFSIFLEDGFFNFDFDNRE